MKLDEVLALLDDVPDYQVFLTVDELNESARKLAEQYPQTVEWFEIGHSRAGERIHALKIGSGSQNALLFAMPHPNEPIGSMMLEYLSGKLAADDDLRERLDYTWYIVKCIDVDGTRLNEGWFKGPFSVTHYARNYYRPASEQQVEWTFPVEYKTLKFDQPMPETQALMGLIEQIKPEFMFSLHNSGFGGVYLYLSDDMPDFYPDFYKLVKSRDLPLHLGEPETPYAVQFADAVYSMLGIQDSYDFIEKNMDKDPAEIIHSGASSYEYACRFGDPFFLVCEMPYFYNPEINDTSPTDETRRELVLQGLNASRAQVAALREQFEKVRAELTHPSAFRESTEALLKFYEDYFTAQRNWATNDPALLEKATKAEKFDNLYGSRFYLLLGLGTALRMMNAQIEATGETPKLLQTRDEMNVLFTQEASELEKILDYQVIPIKKLVGVQLGCALLLASAVHK